jgi:putative heme iron utilization protein
VAQYWLSTDKLAAVTKEFNLDNIQTEFQHFLDHQKTVQLATLDSNNAPDASYAPYVKFENAYYLFLSDLAKHSINLKQNPAISLLFIEDEATAKNLFARRRVVLRGRATVINRESSTYATVMAEFKHCFGGFIDVIEPLQDFNLFQIAPKQGRFIRGFAQAFELSGEGLNQLQHVNPGAS